MGHIPSIFLYSAGAAVFAVVGFFIVHRLFKPIDLVEHQQFLDAMLNIVGTLVSILLGLLVAAALDRYQALDDSVDNEAANVSEIFRMTAGLPLDMQVKLRKLCASYGDAVVNDEWPLMATGKNSEKVLLTYADMVATIASYQPDTDGESNIHQSLITSVQEVGDCRRKRLLAMNSNWTKQLMPLLVMCSLIVLAFAYLYAKRGAVMHAVLICFVAISLGGNLGLVFLLGNPFAGDWKIQPRGFLLNKALIQKFQSDPQLQKLMNGINAQKNAAKAKAKKEDKDDDNDKDDASDK